MINASFMRAILVCATLALTSILPSANAQKTPKSRSVDLFEVVKAKSTPVEQMREDELNRTYFRLKSNPFLEGTISPGVWIEVPHSEGLERILVDRVDRHTQNTLTVSGRDERTGAVATIVWYGERLSGKMHLGNAGGLVLMRFDPVEGLSYASRIKHDAIDHLLCGDNEAASSLSVPGLGLRRRSQPASGSLFKSGSGELQGSLVSPPTLSAMSDMLDDTVTIDVLIAYTPAAQQWAETCYGGSGCTGAGNIEAYAAAAIGLSQTVLDNSELPMRFRLVGLHRLDYDETSDNVSSGDRLERLTASVDFNPWDATVSMDDVHAARDAVGADLVAGFFQISDVGGIAWRIGSPSGVPELGFSVNRIQQMASSYTLAHEIGHNMGLSHSRNQSSNAASVFGGMFTYSVGYRWLAGGVKGYSTVMGYTEGYDDAPMFSSPLLNWANSPAGAVDGQWGPSDSRQSLNQVKYAIASYRPSRFQPPGARIYTDQIEVTLRNTDASFTMDVPIHNLGQSDLMWHLDVSRGQSLAKASTSGADREFRTDRPTVAPLFDLGSRAKSGSGTSRGDDISDMAPVATAEFAMSDNSIGVIYDEGFEQVDIGAYNVMDQWRTNNTSFDVDALRNNPADGERHVRMYTNNESQARWFRSPFMGPLPTGLYELSFDLYIRPDLTTQGFNRFDLYVYDGTTGDLSSGIVLLSGDQIYAWNFDRWDPTNGLFYGTGVQAKTQAYSNYRIVYNPAEDAILYYVDDQLIAKNAYTFGTAPDYFYFYLQSGDNPGTYYDVDNVKLVRGPVYPWFEPGQWAGTVSAESVGSIPLTFNSNGLTSGTFQANLDVFTNDTEVPRLRVPIQFSIIEGLFDIGDVDGNERVQAYDAALVLQYVVGMEPLPQSDPRPWETSRLEAADVDGDSQVMAMDASLILQHTVDLITQFPAEGSGATKSNGVAYGRVQEPAVSVVARADSLVFSTTAGLAGFELEMPMKTGLRFGEVAPIWEGAMTAAYLDSAAGVVRIAFAAMQSEDGEFLKVPFTVDRSLVANPGELTLAATVRVNAARHEVVIDFSGELVGVSVQEGPGVGDQIPTEYRLEANYPNPFNPTTRIAYALVEAQPVRLEVYSITGAKVVTLVDGVQPAGVHAVEFDASGLSSGVYLYRISTPAFSQTKAMVLMK